MSRMLMTYYANFPGVVVGEESICNAGDLGLIPGLEISPGEGNGNPLQCSCLENPMDRGAWQTTFQGVTKSLTGLSDFHFHFSPSETISIIGLLSTNM